jgi:hypothetical protein
VSTKCAADNFTGTTAGRIVFIWALLVVSPFATQRVTGEWPTPPLAGGSPTTTQPQLPRATIPATGPKNVTDLNLDWPNYGNDPGGMRFSPLTEINRGNVARLKVAWVFHTGETSDGTRCSTTQRF